MGCSWLTYQPNNRITGCHVLVNRLLTPLKAEQERLQEELTEAAAMAAMPPPAAAAQPKEDDQLRMSQDDDEGEEGAKPDDPLVVHKCLEIIFQLMQESREWY